MTTLRIPVMAVQQWIEEAEKANRPGTESDQGEGVNGTCRGCGFAGVLDQNDICARCYLATSPEYPAESGDSSGL